MADPAGEPAGEALRLDFDRRLVLRFRGAAVSSDAGLLACRELGDAGSRAVFAVIVVGGSRPGCLAWEHPQWEDGHMPIPNVKAAALLAAATACIAVISAPPAIAGPWEDAAAAYERGDAAEAVRLLRPLADGGDAEAQALLGFEYTLGEGVPQDLTQAMIWYRRAAEQGHAGAQAALGVMYADGRGVPRDRAEALRWLRPAAAAGNETARTELARVEAEQAPEARDRQPSGQSQPSPAAAEASTAAPRAPAPEAGRPASSPAPPAADPTASAAGAPGTADVSASPAAPAADPGRLAAAAAGRTAVPEAAAPRRDPDLLAVLVRRGDAMLAAGDVSAARLYYERAAAGGSAAGAAGVGKTHDPAFLSRLDGFGIRSDPSVAATWYRKAVALGDPEAERLLRRLGAAVADRSALEALAAEQEAHPTGGVGSRPVPGQR